MTTDTTTSAGETTLFLGEAWFDPIEAGIREQIRGFIEGAALLGGRRYELRPRPIWSSGRFARPREGCFACKSRPSDQIMTTAAIVASGVKQRRSSGASAKI